MPVLPPYEKLPSLYVKGEGRDINGCLRALPAGLPPYEKLPSL